MSLIVLKLSKMQKFVPVFTFLYHISLLKCVIIKVLNYLNHQTFVVLVVFCCIILNVEGVMIVLNEQRKVFVNEYIKLKCKNATQAAINAGYSKKTAQSQASQILKDSNVQEYLKQQKDQISRELREEFIFDALEAKKVMYDIMTDPDAEDRDKINVAKDFLDRAGFKPTDELKVSGEVNNPFAELSTEELKKLVNDE